MEYTVFFTDKSVSFSRQAPAEACHTIVFYGDEDVSRAKILKILETENSLVVTADDPDRAFAAFSAAFTPVEAAGGVVVNDRGEWLMIHRNGRWDLPKGHVESGETCDVCAVREIAEETGVCDAEVIRPLCGTFHAYYFPRKGRWELKRTHWYELHVSACNVLAPQIEEGIERVEWCAPSEVVENLKRTYPTIRCVAAALGIS